MLGLALALVVSLALLWFGIKMAATGYDYHERTTPVADGVETSGIVQAADSSAVKGVTFTTGTVEFTARDGRIYRFKTPPLHNLYVGEAVRVSYSPTSPSDAHEVSLPYALGVLFYVGVAIGLAGLVVLARTTFRATRPAGPPPPRVMPRWRPND